MCSCSRGSIRVTLYLLIGIISAICSGVAYNLVRRLREREEPIVVVLHFQLVGIAVRAGSVFQRLKARPLLRIRYGSFQLFFPSSPRSARSA